MAALPQAASVYPSRNFVAVVPNDTTILPDGVRGLICLTAGTLAVDNWNDVTASIPLTAGQVIPLAPKRVKVATTGTYLLLR